MPADWLADILSGKRCIHGNSFSERILESLKLGQTVSLYIDQYRSPVWVEDLARALLELADHSFCGLIHLGGSDRIDRYTFGLALAEKAGYSQKLLEPVFMNQQLPDAPRPRDVSFCIEKAISVLNTPLSGFKEGISFMFS